MKRWWITGIIFLFFLCCGCGREEEREEGKVLSRAIAVYDGDLSVLGASGTYQIAGNKEE